MGAQRRKKGSRRRPGELENGVLSLLWDAGEPLSPSEVQERFGQELSYATISTILTRLHAKGTLNRTGRGRAHLYEPWVSRSDHISEQVRRLLAQGGDRPAVLQGFLGGLSKGDERALRELLERTTSKQKKPPASPGT